MGRNSVQGKMGFPFDNGCLSRKTQSEMSILEQAEYELCMHKMEA